MEVSGPAGRSRRESRRNSHKVQPARNSTRAPCETMKRTPNLAPVVKDWAEPVAETETPEPEA